MGPIAGTSRNGNTNKPKITIAPPVYLNKFTRKIERTFTVSLNHFRNIFLFAIDY